MSSGSQSLDSPKLKLRNNKKKQKAKRQAMQESSKSGSRERDGSIETF